MNHKDYAGSLNSLAFVYSSRGDYPRAESLYRQVVEIRKQALGENNQYYAASLGNLANLYSRQGKYYARLSHSCFLRWRSARRCWGKTTPISPPA